MTRWLEKIIRLGEEKTKEIDSEDLYSDLIKVVQIEPELYRVEEKDTEKGYRISVISSRTGEIIYETKI